jgi:glycosyltransferase involved in cell wall biosynthesis
VPEACYDPIRRVYHGWKKALAGPIERFCLRRCDKIVATCEAEAEWIRDYLGKRCPSVEVTDIKRFFNLSHVDHAEQVEGRPLHLLYLGRRHPLKGLEYLESAVAQLNAKWGNRSDLFPHLGTTGSIRLIDLKVVSNAFGEEKEQAWKWSDALVLPTLSENFGLVIAEALERGKRVITTDGAPAWGENLSRVEHVECVESGEILSGYEGRLIYLKGYRDGTPEERVWLLKNVIEELVCHQSK